MASCNGGAALGRGGDRPVLGVRGGGVSKEGVRGGWGEHCRQRGLPASVR